MRSHLVFCHELATHQKYLHCALSHLHVLRRKDECEGGGDIQTGKVSGFKESITQRWQATDDYAYIVVSIKNRPGDFS